MPGSQNTRGIRSQGKKSRMTDGYLAGKSNEQIKAHGQNHVNANEDQNSIVVRADPPQCRGKEGDQNQKDHPS
jgi:type II secretory pathway component GspD/PulD (secretin)